MTRLPLLLLSLLAACTSTGPSDILTVLNRSPSTLVVLALPAVSGPVVDPAPQLGVIPENRRVEAGGTLGIDTVPGQRPGDGILLFVYAVGSDAVARFVESRIVEPTRLDRFPTVTLTIGATP